MYKQTNASQSVADSQESELTPLSELSQAGIEALRSEVEKWQARVPKLASALRERTDELAHARDEIRRLAQDLDKTSDDGFMGVTLKSRDELIAELEVKSKTLSEKVRSLSGEVHTLQLALQESVEEGESWKAKWRDVTSTLDQVSGDKNQLSSQHAAELDALGLERNTLHSEVKHLQAELNKQARLGDQVVALRKRNEDLSETTEMANIQMATLGEELASLVERAETAEQARGDLEGRFDASEAALEKAMADLTQAEQAHETAVAQLRAAHEQALAPVHLLLAETKDALADADRRCTEQTARLATHEDHAKQEAIAHRADLARLEEELAVACHDRAQWHEAVQGLKTELAQRDANHEKMVVQMVAAADADKRAAQATLDTLNAALVDERARSAQIDDLGAEITLLESRLADASNAHAQVEGERQRMADRLSGLEQQIKAANDALERKADEAANDAGRIEAFETAVAAQAQEIETLNTALDDERARSAQIDDLGAEVVDLESRLADASIAQAQVEGERQALADRLSGLEQQIKAANDALERKADEAANDAGRIEAFETAVAAQAQEIETLNTALDDERARSAQIDDLGAEVVNLESRLADASIAQAKVEGEREKLADALSSLEQEAGEARRSLTQNSLEQARTESRIEKLEKALEARTELVQNLEEERNERLHNSVRIQANADQLQQELTAANQRAETLQAHAAAIEGKLGDQRELMDELEHELSEKQTELADEQRRAALQLRLRTDLERQLRSSQPEPADEYQPQTQGPVTKREEQVAHPDSGPRGSEHKVAELSQELEVQQGALQEAESKAVVLSASLASQAQAFEVKISRLEEQICQRDDQREVCSERIAELEQQLKTMEAEHIALKAESVDAAEVQALRKQVREFESKFRDRTRELNELRWRQDQEKSVPEDENMLLVLSQQLKDARAELERLQAKASARVLDDSDLTRINGVGEKLSNQLNALGIRSISQLAGVEKQDLDDKDHLLHDYRGRVFRDGWIEQARDLIDN